MDSSDSGEVSISSIELEKMLQLRLQASQAERSSLREELEALDGRIKKMVTAIGKRPIHSDAELTELARQKEFTHGTTNMTLMQEKEYLREMDSIRQKKKDLVEFSKRQAEIEVLRASRVALSATLRETEEQLNQLFDGSRKLAVASTLKCNAGDVTEKKITVPEDNMARVIGKGGSGVRAIEEEFHVVVYSERANVFRIMGLEESVSAAFDSLLIKANSVTETLALHPALKACLMVGKAYLTKDIQDRNEVKMNFNKDEFVCRISGQPANVAAAKAEVLALSFSKIKVKVDSAVIPQLVGRAGSNLRSMYDENHVQVCLLKDESAVAVYGLLEYAVPVGDAIRRFCEDSRESVETLPVSAMVLNACFHSITSLQKKGASITLAHSKTDEDSVITVQGAHGVVSSVVGEIRAVIAAYMADMVTLEFHSSTIPSIIGKAGSNIKKVRAEYGKATISVSGSKVFVHCIDAEVRTAAVDAISSLARANYSESLHMDREVSVSLRGSVGEVVRAKMSTLGISMNIDAETGTVRLTGTEEAVAAGKALLTVFSLNSQSLEMAVHVEDSSAVASMIVDLEARFGVHMSLLNKRQQVRFIGTKEGCQEAKLALSHIIEGAPGSGARLLKLQSNDYSVVIGSKGRNLEILERQFNVRIDVVKYKNGIRLRGTDASCEVAEREIVRIIAENTRTSSTVPIPEELSPDVVSRCLNETSRVFGLDLSVRVADRAFQLKGRREIVEAAALFLTDLVDGVVTVTVPLIDRHAIAVRQSQFDGIARSKSVNIRLDIQRCAFIVCGAISCIRAAVDEVYSTLDSLFPNMYMGKTVNSFCLGDISSFYDIAAIENRADVKLHVDRYMGKVYVRGEDGSVVKAVALIEERVAVWTATHEVIDGFDEHSFSNMLAKQAELLISLEKETGTSLRISRSPRSIVVEGASRDEVLKAKPIVLANLSATVEGGSWGVEIHHDVVGSLIGKGGAVIKKLRAETGAVIDFDPESYVVKVTGSDDAIASAKEKIQEIIDTKTPIDIAVSPGAFPLIIGAKGANIKAVEESTGAKISVDNAREVVVVRGSLSEREAAAAVIRDKLREAGFEEIIPGPREANPTPYTRSVEIGACGDFLPENVATKNYNKEKRLAKQYAFKALQADSELPSVAHHLLLTAAPVHMTESVVSDDNHEIKCAADDMDVSASAEIFHGESVSLEEASMSMDAGEEEFNFFGQVGPPNSSEFKHAADDSECCTRTISAASPVSTPLSPAIDANTAFLLNLLNIGAKSTNNSNAKDAVPPSSGNPIIASPGLSGTPAQYSNGKKVAKIPIQSAVKFSSTVNGSADQNESSYKSSGKYFKSKSGFSVRL